MNNKSHKGLGTTTIIFILLICSGCTMNKYTKEDMQYLHYIDQKKYDREQSYKKNPDCSKTTKGELKKVTCP